MSGPKLSNMGVDTYTLFQAKNIEISFIKLSSGHLEYATRVPHIQVNM